jgi:hypothetical protein
MYHPPTTFEKQNIACIYSDCTRCYGGVDLIRVGGTRVQAGRGAYTGPQARPRHPHLHAAAEAFLREALSRGHEGLMAKDVEAAYAAGSRGNSWLKIKHNYTLDLVVLAAEWGSGRPVKGG